MLAFQCSPRRDNYFFQLGFLLISLFATHRLILDFDPSFSFIHIKPFLSDFMPGSLIASLISALTIMEAQNYVRSKCIQHLVMQLHKTENYKIT